MMDCQTTIRALHPPLLDGYKFQRPSEHSSRVRKNAGVYQPHQNPKTQFPASPLPASMMLRMVGGPIPPHSTKATKWLFLPRIQKSLS